MKRDRPGSVEVHSYVRKNWDEDEIETLIRMYQAGYTYQEIGDKLGRSYLSVSTAAKRIFTGKDREEIDTFLKERGLNVKPKHEKLQMRNRRWSPDDDLKLIELYRAHVSNKKIAKMLNRTEDAVVTRLYHVGEIVPRSNRGRPRLKERKEVKTKDKVIRSKVKTQKKGFIQTLRGMIRWPKVSA